MRIATWNINGLRARIDFVKHWLEARQPDIVGLQELKMADELFPHEAFESVGYHAVTHGQKAWNGVAILSREPAEVIQRGLPGQEEFGSRLITARVSGLTFSTVYVPNGKSIEHDDFARKLAWLEALTRHLTDTHTASEPHVLNGDFNLCPAAIDSWNEARMKGTIFHTDEERERFADLLKRGFNDAFRQRFPDTQAFSWWDYRGGAFHKKQGLRIDFLLATDAVMQRLKSVEIDRDYRKKKGELQASDHAPVIAELE